MFPPEITKSVAVYHIPATGSTVYPTIANATIQAALLPLDRKEHALEGGEYTVPYELYVEGSEDVRTGDKLVIDGENYYCKSIFSANFGGMPHKRLSLSSQP